MSFATVSPTTDYSDLLSQARGLLMDESDPIANAANLAALIYHGVPGLNWAGFYFLKEDELVLGPFQGQPACVRISLGQGVCGTAAATGRTQRVADVQAFPGHIACDPASRSEVVVPLWQLERVIGVLDIDSPEPNRFAAEEQELFETLARLWWVASFGPDEPRSPGIAAAWFINIL